MSVHSSHSLYTIAIYVLHSVRAQLTFCTEEEIKAAPLEHWLFDFFSFVLIFFEETSLRSFSFPHIEIMTIFFLNVAGYISLLSSLGTISFGVYERAPHYRYRRNYSSLLFAIYSDKFQLIALSSHIDLQISSIYGFVMRLIATRLPLLVLLFRQDSYYIGATWQSIFLHPQIPHLNASASDFK